MGFSEAKQAQIVTVRKRDFIRAQSAPFEWPSGGHKRKEKGREREQEEEKDF